MCLASTRSSQLSYTRKSEEVLVAARLWRVNRWPKVVRSTRCPCRGRRRTACHVMPFVRLFSIPNDSVVQRRRAAPAAASACEPEPLVHAHALIPPQQRSPGSPARSAPSSRAPLRAVAHPRLHPHPSDSGHEHNGRSTRRPNAQAASCTLPRVPAACRQVGRDSPAREIRPAHPRAARRPRRAAVPAPGSPRPGQEAASRKVRRRAPRVPPWETRSGSRSPGRRSPRDA